MAQVLIVDDDPVSRLVSEHILVGAGHGVTTVDGAAAARDAMRRDVNFDIVLSDYRMPDEDGLDLLDSLGEERPPFVLLTGVGELDGFEDDRVEAVDAFLTKPVASAELVELIKELSER